MIELLNDLTRAAQTTANLLRIALGELPDDNAAKPLLQDAVNGYDKLTELIAREQQAAGESAYVASKLAGKREKVRAILDSLILDDGKTLSGCADEIMALMAEVAR